MNKNEQRQKHKEATAAAKMNKMREQIAEFSAQQAHKRNTNKVAMAWELVKAELGQKGLEQFDFTEEAKYNKVFFAAFRISESFLDFVDEKFNPKSEVSNVEQTGNPDSGTNVELATQEPRL